MSLSPQDPEKRAVSRRGLATERGQFHESLARGAKSGPEILGPSDEGYDP